jgi:hypothetical protein
MAVFSAYDRRSRPARRFASVEELEAFLATPSPALVADMQRSRATS